MKTKTTSRSILVVSVILLSAIFRPQSASAQCIPTIKIDGNDIVADETNSYGIKLPSWLKAGQTLAKSVNVYSISVIEFSVNGTALDYAQNLSVSTIQTVPANKVWKIESIHKDASSLLLPVAVNTYTVGTSTFSPPCNGSYSVKIWGAGGGGGGGNNCCNSNGSGGGGGGGYTEGVYTLLGGTTYTIVVGAGGTAGAVAADGGAGNTSSVSGISISATGGAGGQNQQNGGAGGAGGTGVGGQTILVGTVGVSTSGSGGNGGAGAATGGAGGNGGAGAAGIAGTIPGGGGGGGDYLNWVGAAGADGRVTITKAGGTATGSTGRDKLQATGIINATVTASCGYVVPAGYVFRLDAVMASGANAILSMSTTCASTGDRGTLSIITTPTSGSTAQSWPYPIWFLAGTYFYYATGSAYIHGVEYTIE